MRERYVMMDDDDAAKIRGERNIVSCDADDDDEDGARRDDTSIANNFVRIALLSLRLPSELIT
jgi:hypothetical protein